MLSLLERLAARSKWALAGLGILLSVVIGIADVETGFEVSWSVFYLVPVFLVTWSSNRALGLLISFVSATCWFLADKYSGHVYSHPAIPYWNTAARLVFFCVTAHLLAALREANHKIVEQARLDPLTRLANGRAFADSAALHIDRCNRYGRPFSVAYMDLDNFKWVNDHQGHSAGDQLLRITATTLRASLRASDVAARLGGDEFAVLLPEISFEGVSACLAKLRSQLLEQIARRGWPVSVSIGAVTFLTAPQSVDDLVEQADKLMYSVKRAGKNGVRHVLAGAEQ